MPIPHAGKARGALSNIPPDGAPGQARRAFFAREIEETAFSSVFCKNLAKCSFLAKVAFRVFQALAAASTHRAMNFRKKKQPW